MVTYFSSIFKSKSGKYYGKMAEPIPYLGSDLKEYELQYQEILNYDEVENYEYYDRINYPRYKYCTDCMNVRDFFGSSFDKYKKWEFVK